jgi:hypothetical protein
VSYKRTIDKGEEMGRRGRRRIKGLVLDKIKYENLYFSQLRHGLY